MPCRYSYNLKETSKQIVDKFGNLCCWYVFPLRAYCMTVAVVGFLVTTLDIHRVLVDGPKLSDRVWPMRQDETGSGSQQVISEEAERDVKLVTSVVEWTVYFCLLIGTYYETPLFLVPWLLIRFFILVSSVVLCFVKLISQKPMEVSALGLVSFLLLIHNFLYVSCLFKKLTLSQSVTSWF